MTVNKRIRSDKLKLGFSQKLILILSVCLLACLLSVTIYTRRTTRDTMKRNALEIGIASTENQTDLLEMNLDQIENLYESVYSNADVYRLLRSSSLNSTQIYRITLFLRSMMSMSVDMKINQIYLDVYSSGQSFIINTSGSSSSGPSRYHVNFPDSVSADQVYCEGPHLTTAYGYNLSNKDTEVFSFHWKLYDNAQEHVIGALSFDIALTDFITYIFPETDDIGFLMSGGSIIFGNNISLSNQTARNILQSCFANRWSEIQTDSLEGIAIYSTAKLSNVNLQLVRIIPEAELYAEANTLIWNNTRMIFLCFLLCAVIMYLAVRQLMKPIQQLDAELQKIQTQDNLQMRMADQINYKADDEVGRLILQTDEMLETVETLFQRQEMLSQAQRDAEAKMLQAQINPHFLYNSLQSLAALALERGQKDIYRYITMLGSRMHYSMDLEHTTALLKQEFDYVTNYVVLQDVRFHSGIQLDVNLSPDAASITVPRMILQPIVENAFKHGKLCRSAGTYMKMSGERYTVKSWTDLLLPEQLKDHISADSTYLILTFENNGLLMEDERVEELNQKFAEPGVPRDASMNEHIGMHSVLYRLRLFFSDNVQMYLEQPGHQAVRITIVIPITDE